MNKLGIFINFWEKNWDCDHAKYIKKASDLGFDVLEFQAQALLEMSKERLTELKKMADDNNIELTYSLGLDPRFDVSSADENIRQGGIEYLKNIVERVGFMDALFSAYAIVGTRSFKILLYDGVPTDKIAFTEKLV